MTAAIATSGDRCLLVEMERGFLRWTAAALVAVTWISAGIFGIYVLFHYGGAVPAGVPEQWNKSLPKLYEAATPGANLGIGAHFAAGGILLFLGPIQLFGAIRARAPAVHRWIGRAYVLGGLVAGVGGLTYILAKGTVGGWPMNIGFGLYGALMILTSVEAYRHARARRIDRHRAWALRLFALSIGSWLYRMDYGFWAMATGSLGSTGAYDGPFDVVMTFFFYVPNLAVAELFIRAREARARPGMRAFAGVVLAGATFFLGLGTYYFIEIYWWPGIAERLA